MSDPGWAGSRHAPAADSNTARSRVSKRWKAFQAGLAEYYAGPYRRTFAREKRNEDDYFTLLVLGEALGVPDPAAYYTTELMPALYDDFHEWHRRMGMDRSPLEHVACC